MLKPIQILATKKPAKAAVIFLHGLGDTGNGWSWFPDLVKQAGIIKDPSSINYIFPNAPEIPITVNGGYRMPGWFDIYEFGNPDGRQDVNGFFSTCEYLKRLINEQINEANISPDKIIIGGFSQGAAIALATLTLLDFKIGGVVALSGFCPVRKDLGARSNKDGTNYQTPVFQGHGTSDPVIDHTYGEQTSQFYKDLGYKKLDFHSYPGVAHSASEQELAEAMKFIGDIIEK